MLKRLAFLVLALLFVGHMEGRDIENSTLLPTSYSVLNEDTVPPLQVISLRNERADLHQIIIPKQTASLQNTGTTIDPDIMGPAYLNVFEMIQGRVAGVWVTGSNNNYQMRIRGSLQPPMVVIDGMTFRSFDDQSLNNLLNSIPPADVDYIEVLKGIAQTAIYGPGSGNGVIIVHTKHVELENDLD
ncbi:MAG: TonB-dependent receptor plug domain-containing protein [Saprospiraceae bacterium]|nr:TonB-dependent receptor plug domain-containing protein [Saprospiraceae bacterium]